jgi:hypothetical protein
MNADESRKKILPRMARMARIFLEQKGTKEPEFFFVTFVCSRGNCFPMAARMENFLSV